MWHITMPVEEPSTASEAGIDSYIRSNVDTTKPMHLIAGLEIKYPQTGNAYAFFICYIQQ